MPIDSAWNAYIFRDGKSLVRGPALLHDLAVGLSAFATLEPYAQRSALLDLLLRAGELECALEDAGSPDAPSIQSVTDQIAESLLGGATLCSEELARRVECLTAPGQVQVAIPEGFAYYALHPLDYADLVGHAETGAGVAAVVGIRSIGTTLGAVVQAALRSEGRQAGRISVRPEGHPYNRQCRFSAIQQKWIVSMLARGAAFFVVDEGPGMSGSSFLSVGEALVAAGVPRAQVTFLCSRQPVPAALTAADAALRWPMFAARHIEPTRHLPARAKQYVAGGIWRARAFSSEEDWPSSWLQMERLKFLSEGGEFLFRFEGFGRFGASVTERVQAIDEAGFGPKPEAQEEGFGVYRMLNGRYLSAAGATPAVLSRMAQYCAFRACAMKAEVTNITELETMLGFNVREEFGIDIPLERSSLPVERPVIADGRMLPHKWLEHEGLLLKLDAATHGDDHFFPGPTDISWDLAGTIIEWNLNAEAAAFFLGVYRRQSGDDPSRRLPAYLLAYAIFRTAYCKMAAAAMSGAPEQERLLRDYRCYRERARRLLEASSLKSMTSTGIAA